MMKRVGAGADRLPCLSGRDRIARADHEIIWGRAAIGPDPGGLDSSGVEARHSAGRLAAEPRNDLGSASLAIGNRERLVTRSARRPGHPDIRDARFERPLLKRRRKPERSWIEGQHAAEGGSEAIVRHAPDLDPVSSPRIRGEGIRRAGGKDELRPGKALDALIVAKPKPRGLGMKHRTPAT